MPAAPSRLADWIAAVCTIDPHAPELEFDGRWWSWHQLADDAARLNEALQAAGLHQGTRVGVLLRNRAPLVPVLLALFASGRCLASLNANAPDDKLAEDIRRAAVPVLVALDADWDRAAVREAAGAIGAIGLRLAEDGASEVLPVPDLAGDPSRWTNRDAAGVAIEMLSSGTTGTPKRIPLTTQKFEQALLGAASFEKGREDGTAKLRSGVQIVTAPLAHIAGITGVMNNILAGRKICLIEKFTVAAFRDAVVRHRPKVAGAPPSALRMLLDADIPRGDLASLVAFRTGTAPLDPDLADAFHERYGIPVLQNYGATEFAGGVAGWTLSDFETWWSAKRGSVGRLNKGVEARVLDPDGGSPALPGKTGLLALRGGNIGSGEWVRTTDLASIDDDGFLWIRGRHDGAIIRGGFKILPDDVIKAMETHPAVREAAVVGRPDRRLGQVPVAAYVAKSGAEPPDEASFKSYLKDRLMPYQVPVRLLHVADLPRTPSMKVDQPALKALLADDAPES